MRDRTLHALIGPNGAGKTTAFNLISGMFPPDAGSVTLAGRSIGGLSPEAITQAGVGRSFQITNLFPALTIEENVRLAVQARSPRAFDPWTPAQGLDAVNAETAGVIATMGLGGVEKAEAGSLSYGGQRLLDMSLALATKPRVLLLDEPLAGLAAAERERVGNLIKSISRDMPVLLVEHDIDRVFQIADHVTVMNDGAVLVDGDVETARSSAKVQEVYIGSGSHALAEKHRPSAARDEALLSLSDVDTFYGKSHILRSVSFEVRRNEIVAFARAERRGQVDAAQDHRRRRAARQWKRGARRGATRRPAVVVHHPARRQLRAAGQGPVRRHVGEGEHGARTAASPQWRGHALGRGQDLLLLPAHPRALVVARGLSFGRRAADGLPWRAPSPATRRFCCWTSPSRASLRRSSRSCSRPSTSSATRFRS